jgi:hypothetical protein
MGDFVDVRSFLQPEHQRQLDDFVKTRKQNDPSFTLYYDHADGWDATDRADGCDAIDSADDDADATEDHETMSEQEREQETTTTDTTEEPNKFRRFKLLKAGLRKLFN